MNRRNNVFRITESDIAKLVRNSVNSILESRQQKNRIERIVNETVDESIYNLIEKKDCEYDPYGEKTRTLDRRKGKQEPPKMRDIGTFSGGGKKQEKPRRRRK